MPLTLQKSSVHACELTKTPSPTCCSMTQTKNIAIIPENEFMSECCL